MQVSGSEGSSAAGVAKIWFRDDIIAAALRAADVSLSKSKVVSTIFLALMRQSGD